MKKNPHPQAEAVARELALQLEEERRVQRVSPASFNPMAPSTLHPTPYTLERERQRKRERETLNPNT